MSTDAEWLAVARAEADIYADCRRAQHGAVLVSSSGEEIGCGWNDSIVGSCSKGDCPRGLLTQLDCPTMSNYSNCIAKHAEERALENAWSRSYIHGSTMFLTGAPCARCRLLMTVAGVRRVVWPDGEIALPVEAIRQA